MKKYITYITATLFSVGLFTLTAEEPTEFEQLVEQVHEARANQDFNWSGQEAQELQTAMLDARPWPDSESSFLQPFLVVYLFAETGERGRTNLLHADLEKVRTLDPRLSVLADLLEGQNVTSQVQEGAWRPGSNFLLHLLRTGVSLEVRHQIVDLLVHTTGSNVWPPSERHLTVWSQQFKAYRSTLSTQDQIDLTKAERDRVISISERPRHLDVWLRELTADLMALQLGD